MDSSIIALVANFMMLGGLSAYAVFNVFDDDDEDEETTETPLSEEPDNEATIDTLLTALNPTDGSAPADEDFEPDLLDETAYQPQIAGTIGDDALAGAEADAARLSFAAGAGDDLVTGSDGADYAEGGSGDDTLRLEDGEDIALGGAGDDVLSAMAGSDVLFGGGGGDVLASGMGDDALFGGAGDDNLSGGADNDVLFGGSGADTLFGGDGFAGDDVKTREDTLSGGSGEDRIFVGGRDVAIGGADADQFVLDETIPDHGRATISDYGAGDEIEIRYRTDDVSDDAPPPDVTIRNFDAEDPTAGVQVFINGERFALVQGDRAVEEADLRLVAVEG